MLGAVDSMRPSPADPGREDIEDALERILGSPDFISSDRKSQFLSYIVDETLSGRAARIKGYDIALAVFDRDANFDAQSDPLVRVEAGRLRHSLEHYYLTTGQLDPVRISIPKGRYVPLFSFADSVAAAVEPPAPDPEIEARREARGVSERRWRAVAWLAAFTGFTLAVISTVYPLRSQDPDAPRPSAIVLPGPSLLVQRFANLGSDAADEHLSSAILEELAGALARFKTIRVFSVADRESTSGTASTRATQPRQYDYVVRGSIRRQNGTLRVAVYLEDGQTGHRLWTEVVENAAPATESLAAQKRIAASIAATLGNPYDVLFTQEAKRLPLSAATKPEIYACALQFYAYWEHLRRSEHRAIRDCHESASRTTPLYADIWVNLAFLYVDEHRFGYNPCDDCSPPLRRAAEAARRAITLEPDNARAHLAMAIVHWFRLDFPAFNEEAEQALSLNENDRLIAAELGLRFTLRGDWGRALPLLEQSVGRAPFKPRLYRIAYALRALEMEDDALAREEMRRVELTDHPISCLIDAVLLARGGHTAEALAAWRSFTQKVPSAAVDLRSWLLSRGISAPLTERVMHALEKTLAAGA
jgi:adenylate cyclase